LGEYLNAGQFVVAEGGWSDPEAVKGTLEAIAQCTALGPPWIGKHPQTKRTLYLRLRFMFKEQFTESWEDFRSFLGESIQENASTPQAKAIVGGASGQDVVDYKHASTTHAAVTSGQNVVDNKVASKNRAAPMVVGRENELGTSVAAVTGDNSKSCKAQWREAQRLNQ